MVFCIAWVLISVAFNYFGDKDTKSFGIMVLFPTFFIYIKAKGGQKCRPRIALFIISDVDVVSGW